MKNHRLHGRGTYTFPDGTEVKGEWSDDSLVKDVKINDIKTNLRDVEALLPNIINGFYPATYEGDFKDGKRSGSGILTYADGRIYKGKFSNNLPNEV